MVMENNNNYLLKNQKKDFISEFCLFNSHEKNLSDMTVRNYRNDLILFERYTNSIPIGIEKISNLQIRQYVSKLVEEKYSRKSIYRKITAIKTSGWLHLAWASGTGISPRRRHSRSHRKMRNPTIGSERM